MVYVSLAITIIYSAATKNSPALSSTTQLHTQYVRRGKERKRTFTATIALHFLRSFSPIQFPLHYITFFPRRYTKTRIKTVKNTNACTHTFTGNHLERTFSTSPHPNSFSLFFILSSGHMYCYVLDCDKCRVATTGPM